MVVPDAKVTMERGSRVWRCPSCGRMLGEIRDDTVVIKSGDRYLVILLTSAQRQRCPNPRCGEWSELTPMAS